DLSSVPPNLVSGADLGGGLGDLRATARVGILRQEHALLDFAVQASLELPTARQGAFLGDQSAHGEALAAAGRRSDLARGAIDLGAGRGLAKGIRTPGLRIVGGVGLAPAACGPGFARIAPQPPPVRVAEPVRPPPPAAAPLVVVIKPAPAPALELPPPPLVT